MSISRRVFLAISGAAAAFSASLWGQRRSFTLEPDASGSVLKDPDGRIVLGYLTSKPAGVPLEGNSACCIHPFNTPGGRCATDIAPADHRDHRGIFFAWHDMTFTRAGETLRGDFWGWGKFAPTEDRVIVNRNLQLARSDSTSAEVAVRNDWLIGNRTVLQEAATIGVSDKHGARLLDLTYRFTSDFTVTLNRMAFTGLCFRCRKDGRYFYSDPHGEVTLPDSGPTAPESDWPARDWYSHTVERESGATVASAVVDHPSNPPTLWHGVRLVSFLNPCIAAPRAVTLPAGRPLTLRYLAVTQDGPFKPELLNRIAGEWRSGA